MAQDGNHETGKLGEEVTFRALKACVNFRAGGIVPSCQARGADALVAAVAEALDQHGMTLKLERVHCMGRCHLGPTLRLVPAGPYFLGLSPAEGRMLVEYLAADRLEDAKRLFPEPGEGT